MSYHLGHLFLDFIKELNPDAICQIDGATGETETYASVLSRSIRLARKFNKLGLQPGDVLALGGKNHVHLRIPFYAAMLNGLPVAGIDPFFKYDEIKTVFRITEPKIAFCQQENYNDYKRVAEDLGLDVKIVTFDEGDCTLAELLEDEPESIEGFEPATFDTDKVYAWLVSTSGTSGVPKLAAFKHPQLVELFKFFRNFQRDEQIEGKKIGLFISPVQWISSFMNGLGFLAHGTVFLQTSRPDDTEHLIDLINKYRPIVTLCSPSAMASIVQSDKSCDLSCFTAVWMGGAKVYKELMNELRARTSEGAKILEAYGQTETLGPVFVSTPEDPPGCTGTPLPMFDVKLVDPETGKEIKEPNVTGELWTQGPCFDGYYRNPEETEKAFHDGWYKTGDLLYKDENGKYYFVDRLKMLIKYRLIHVIPTELEEVIMSIKGVQEVAVTSVPDPVDGQWPVACVVLRPGAKVTAQEIKDAVASKLSSAKQLRGGVVFLNELPKTSTGKVLRAKIAKIVLDSDRE